MPQISIEQAVYTTELKTKLIQGLIDHAVSVIGLNPWDRDAIAFEAYDGTKFIGGVAVDFLHKQLHVKQFIVSAEYRGQGVGKKLMQRALEFGKTNGCTFAFLETLSYQALDFYTHLGFELEFARDGFDGGFSLLYLRKNLID